MTKTMLRIEGDIGADALYIGLGDEHSVAYSKELTDTIVADFNEAGVLIGIDIQHVSQAGTHHLGAQVTLIDEHQRPVEMSVMI